MRIGELITALQKVKDKRIAVHVVDKDGNYEAELAAVELSGKGCVKIARVLLVID